MKKHLLCLILIFAMLLSSCTLIAPDSGKNTDLPSTDPVLPNVPEVSPISSVDRGLRFREQAYGCEYTSSVTASDNYPDDGSLLTDGSVPEEFDRKSWAGYRKMQDLAIVVDLGTVKEDLADFTAHCLNHASYGIGVPEDVCFEISDDGVSYRKIGKAFRPDVLPESGLVSYRIKLADAVSARYVRFSFGESYSAWTFVGELSVRCYLPESKEIGVYYGDATLPEVDPDDFWPEEEQSSTVGNLIAGRIPYIFSEEEPDEDLFNEYHNSIENLYRLTDGELGVKETYSDAALVHFTKGMGRTLTFDLSHTSAVSGVTLRFLHHASSAVRPPETVTVCLSTDGEIWEQVYGSNSATDDRAGYQTVDISLDAIYKARFVRIYFNVVSHVFCDEIQVFGTTDVPMDAITPTQNVGTAALEPGYPSPEDFLGVNNMLLAYNCYPDGSTHSERGLITKEEFLPHVGYYDKSGRLCDTFFDAFLFLPYAAFNSSEYATSLEGWQFYLDDLYYEDRNMDALNQAVNEVADELDLDDYKCTVFTTIIYPPTQLEGGLEARKDAIRWLMDQEYYMIKIKRN